MAIRRERGVFTFATPPRPLGALTARYRLLLERGDWEGIRRTIMPISALNYDPHIPCLDTDLSPEAMLLNVTQVEQQPGNLEPWMTRNIGIVTRTTLRNAEIIYNTLGKEYIVGEYCPVAWATSSNRSEKEMKEKVASIIWQSGNPAIPAYNLAVSDESLWLYGVSLPVVWMRRSFLRTFKEGNDLLNIYRMMGRRITEKYGIPAYRE